MALNVAMSDQPVKPVVTNAMDRTLFAIIPNNPKILDSVISILVLESNRISSHSGKV